MYAKHALRELKFLSNNKITNYSQICGLVGLRGLKIDADQFMKSIPHRKSPSMAVLNFNMLRMSS